MQTIFNLVANALVTISRVTGFSYNEVNIIAYYILLPFVYVSLIDRIIGFHWLKLICIIFWVITLICIPNFQKFSDGLFDQSVWFLRLFSKIGLNYFQASVVICVMLPLVLLIALVRIL